MITITHLNKIYKLKKQKFCIALKDISLKLPDKGLVFVVGKSGSGKSTLLNLIGGLDDATSGSIEVDGNDLARFREKDFCNYRNSHIGFIFQDYHLIEELTVYDNIALSLNLRHMDSREKVLAALDKVDLAGYEDRYPTELSGGEQQRVAIARAIVKNPRIILADEPTGNLDSNTARSIVALMKKLSRECLILTVSHNAGDANDFADRIIELKNGTIVADRTRNPDFADQMTLKDGKLVYPQGLVLSDGDIDYINSNLTQFVRRTDKFYPTEEDTGDGRQIRIERKNLSFAKKMRLPGKFLKNRVFSISFSALITAVIMIVMSMSQTIISFDAGRVIQEEMEKNNVQSMWLNKTVSDEVRALLNQDYRVEVGENDARMLIDAGYKGDIYPVLNHTIYITSSAASESAVGDAYFKNSPYMTSTFGTMVVGEDFLSKKFGDYSYLARVEDFQPFGVFITDYVADAIRAQGPRYQGKGYEDIVGIYLGGYNGWPRHYINGIIDTGYKERYQELFDRIAETKKFSLTDFYEDEDFQALAAEIYDCLGFSYTTNPNFEEDYTASHLAILPWYYKMNFSGIDSPSVGSYVCADQYRGSKKNGSLIADNWYYMDTPPQIPVGAKYIRVSYNDNLDVLCSRTRIF